jgi:hypothetical protein
MSHDFTLSGSEPSFELDMTFADPEEAKRIFWPPHRQSLRVTGLETYTQHPCPVCGGLVDGWTINDVTTTPGARPDTIEVTGESVTYSPCGHEVVIANGDDEDECIDDTDLCEHGLRFGCENC